ncbi:hypothetical protein ACJMK2_034211 [Sinanodonta woodiana]|uniref:FAM86 N-terminal domain-containing protein n=1 Tax=Sinanodonta woodiana TaxID=1069815 RepID=A0ABD3WUA8_SINWO
MAASIEEQSSIEESTYKSISAQFLQMVPIRRIKWQTHSIEGSQLCPDVQRKVMEATVLSPICQRYPPALSYRRAFMKKFIHILEEFDIEIHDDVYEAYTDLLQQEEEEDDTLCYKTYTLPCGKTISLQESVSMISCGTTGLTTWQAAQHLAEWVLQNNNLFQNRRVLELGSGLGLTGIAVCMKCAVQTYTFSDCHPNVLYLLAQNIQHNLSHAKSKSLSPEHSTHEAKVIRTIKRHLSFNREMMSVDDENVLLELSESVQSLSDGDSDLFDDDVLTMLSSFDLSEKYWDLNSSRQIGLFKQNPSIRLAKFDWEAEDMEFCANLADNADVIIAADVVYDKTIVPALVSVLRNLLTLGSKRKTNSVCAFIASTIRNEDTRDLFLATLSSADLTYELMETSTEEIFHYDRSVPIEILKITMATTT